VLQGVANFVPGVRRLLGTAPLGLMDLAVVAGSALVPLVINEMTKPPMPRELHRKMTGAEDDDSQTGEDAHAEDMEQEAAE